MFYLGEFTTGYTSMQSALAYSSQYATTFGNMGTLLSTVGPSLGGFSPLSTMPTRTLLHLRCHGGE